MKLVFIMNKKGDIIYDSIVYTIIFILFFSGMFWYVVSYADGASYWEDVYSKEIVYIVDRSEPGMSFTIDVTPLAAIASKKGVPVRDIVSFDNINNRVLVRTRQNAGTSFTFFNDVDVMYSPVVSPSGSSTTAQFTFSLGEKQR